MAPSLLLASFPGGGGPPSIQGTDRVEVRGTPLASCDSTRSLPPRSIGLPSSGGRALPFYVPQSRGEIKVRYYMKHMRDRETPIDRGDRNIDATRASGTRGERQVGQVRGNARLSITPDEIRLERERPGRRVLRFRRGRECRGKPRRNPSGIGEKSKWRKYSAERERGWRVGRFKGERSTIRGFFLLVATTSPPRRRAIP